MAREEFIDSLRLADRLLGARQVSVGNRAHRDTITSADAWLTPRSVQGFDPADFADWPEGDRNKLGMEITAFLAIADRVPPSAPATKSQVRQARKHLERIIGFVRDRLLPEWLEAQQELVDEATAAAKAKGWFIEVDQKELLESLLGKYRAPRVRIRTQDREVVLDPIARFGSRRRGIVDLVVMPSYETAYLIAFKNGRWKIVAPHGAMHSRPFSRSTLVSTIQRLPHG